MAYEACHGCFGSGKGVTGSCVFCAGTGRIWVPDKQSYSSSGYRHRGNRVSSGASWMDNAFEDNLASIAMLAVWAYGSYWGINNLDIAWYYSVIGGLIIGYFFYWLLSGPLRMLGSLIKYLFYLGLVILAIYGFYIVYLVFTSP